MKFSFGADTSAIYNDFGDGFAQNGCGTHG
jgi:hypothetical protein